jgi:hypothetical protein
MKTVSAARAIRVADLADPAALDMKIERLLAHHRPLRAGLDLPEPDGVKLKADLLEIAPKILAYAQPVWKLLDEQVKAGKRILFEGAQGVMLDVDHGTYPFVTSSNVVAGNASAGSGVGPARSLMCWASPRPTRRGSALVRSRQSRTMKSANVLDGGPRVRHEYRPGAALRLVRQRDGAPGVCDLGRQWAGADQARRSGRL